MDRLWLPVDQGLAAQRAPLWRADRPQQAGDDRQGRGRAGQDLAPLLRHPAAAAADADSPYDVSARPPLRRHRRAADREPQGHDRACAALLRSARSRRRSAAGKRVLVAAHGNSLRGIIKYLSNISDEDIVGLEIPTGKPIVYELADDLSVDRDRYYLGGAEPRALRRSRGLPPVHRLVGASHHRFGACRSHRSSRPRSRRSAAAHRRRG